MTQLYKLCAVVVALCLALTSTATVFAAPLSTDFDQCANKNPTLNSCDWIGSILQANNAAYKEGMSVPQRLMLQDIPATTGNTHTLTFSHQNTKGGNHAYDFLTAWNQGNSPALTLNACDDLGGDAATCTALRAGSNTLDVSVPDDAFISKDGSTQSRIDAYELAYGDRTIKIYANAPISAASLTLSHSVANGGDTSDSDIFYTLNWTSSATDVLVEMGGHLAISGVSAMGWGPVLGASAINGGPYHFTLSQLDGSSLGAQANQIKGADITVVPNSTLTVIKTVINDDGGVKTASQFTFNVDGTNANVTSFPGSATGTVVKLESGAYSVTEVADPLYVTSYSANCTGNILPGEHRVCTVTNDDIYQVVCGNGITDEGETCDDGNVADGDGCTATCQLEVCGDGVVNNNGAETCDNGAENAQTCDPAYGSSCGYCDSVTCQPVNITGPFCGDDVVNGNEICEVGDDVLDPEHYSCVAETCELVYVPYCGDGNIDNGETCDGTNGTSEHYTCDETCQLEYVPYCGDNIVNQESEVCDDGNNQNGDGCTATCGVEFCGDYTVNNNGTEACDLGTLNGIACVPEYGSSCGYCGSTCQPVNVTGPFCGDNVVNGNEACEVGDDVADPDHYTCVAETCALVYNPYCGDATVDDGEQCDDGNTNDTDACRNSCVFAACGDGVVGPEEVCDDGNTENNDGCNAICQAEFCGDNVLNGDEICEVGDNETDPEHYTCNAQTCNYDYVPYCGDGNIDNGEVCDGTNGTSEHYVCTDVCQLQYVPYCGDWIVNQQSETCDGPESAPENYVCEQNCTLTYVPFCGDNIVNGNEVCEVGDDVADPLHYTCNAQTCNYDYVPYCGDQVVNQESEQCDGAAPEGFTCSENCALIPDYTCEEAIADNLLNGYIVDGVAYVQNDADQAFDVSLAVYQMYALTIDDQTLFDSETTTVEAYSNTTLGVDLPVCAYQIDLVCGDSVPETNPQFGDSLIAHHFGTESEFCVLPSSEDVDLSVAPYYPQGRDYIFVCDPTFEATSFTWYFGDGQVQLDSANDDVFHTYTAAGDYLVSCTATDGILSGSDTLLVSIEPLENETQEEEPVDPEDPVCVDSVYAADVVCNGGEITQDIQIGCRKVTCASEDASLTILACNKPNEAQRTYFEMYKQASSGNGLSVCLGETCIENNGYAQGQLPICTGGSEEETPEETPEEPELEVGVATLSIAPWFPQGNNVVLVCDNSVTDAVFDWSFGDGESLTGVANGNVWHTYPSAGSYDASCTAYNATTTASDTLNVVIA